MNERVGVAAATEGRAEPTTSRRVQRKRGRRVREIVRAAADLFGEHGYDAVNLEDVAAALDVTKGSLYYYFSSKSEIGTAAIETLGNEWIDGLELLAHQHGDEPVVALRVIIREHLRIAVCDHPAVHRLFLAPRDWPQEQAERVKALRSRHDRLFRGIVEQGQKSGEFDVHSIDVTLQCMHAAMTQTPHWASRLKPAQQMSAVDEVTETLMRLFEPARGARR